MEENSKKRFEDCELNFDFKFDFNQDKISDEKKEDDKKEDNIENDSRNFKNILNNLSSIIAVLAAVCTGIANARNAIYASNAQEFYNVSSELFYFDRNFYFFVNIFILIFTLFILVIPFYLSDKWKSKKIDRIESLLYSALISLYMLAILFIIFTNCIVRIFAHKKLIFLKIFIVVVFISLSLLFYFTITGTSKRKSKKNNESGLINDIKNDLAIGKLTRVQKIVYSIYIIFFLVVILSLSSVLSSHGINPEEKMSYEILKDEEDYNVIIGYKDNKAITIAGNIIGSSTNRMLVFTSNEYKLQDISDKVITYETFKNVIKFEGSGSIKGVNGSDSKTVD